MKRHPGLEVFSRDHNVGLILGRKLVRAASLAEGNRQEAAQLLLQYWSDELADHFSEEERLLAPLIQEIELGHRMVLEHLTFSELVGSVDGGQIDPDLLARTGQLLIDHIRWEERVLFPSVEQTASVTQLDELVKQTGLVETRRSHSAWSPRRGELVKKRSHAGANSLVADRLYRLAIERWETEGGLAVTSGKSTDTRKGALAESL